MPLPDPRPGLVIRYDYLWLREAAMGRKESKDRPACLVATIDNDVGPRHVVILPITHVTPHGEIVGIEIPHRVRMSLGLDDAPCWIIVSEHNVDEWPSAGLAPIPSRESTFHYGYIPPWAVSACQSAVFGRACEGTR